MDPKQLGYFGEKIACYYLKNKGYKILDRNYSRKWLSGPQKGEIDIVAQKDNTISFIEVKTIAPAPGAEAILPEDKVNFQKQNQIKKIAQDWLVEKKIPLESKWQIDVISIKVYLDEKIAKIRHLKNVITE